MATKKEQELWQYLQKQNKRWVTAQELADFCNCTTRTVRNRVAKLNQEQPGQILSSNLGYRLTNVEQATFLERDDSPNERLSKIFLALLKNSGDGLDLFDLAQALYISDSTLKNDIQVLRKAVASKNLKLTIKDNIIALEGSERDKRRYMITLLYDEGDYQEKLKYRIQDMIGEISLADLERNIREVLALHQIKINQYSMNNIVLHFAISIERIRQGNDLKRVKNYHLDQTSEEYQLSKEITEILAHYYQIDFANSEIQQLSLLFVGLQNEYRANLKKSQLADFVDVRIIQALREVLVQVKETYLIDLQDEEFFNKLAIHLQSLYDRSKYERYTRNSSLLDIKTAYPLTYDIAVYISMLIQEKLTIWFNDDEISFIALHIGAFLETRKDQTPRLYVLIDTNDYHDFEEVNIQQLRARLGDSVTLITRKDQQFEQQIYDVYLTSDREKAAEVPGAVLVHPIMTRKDLDKVAKRIHMKKKSAWRQKMFGLIERFIKPELYFSQLDPTNYTPASIRQKMFQQMLVKNYVDQEFQATMEKREEMSPTGFPSGIAVPHSIEQNALQSAVSVMTLQDYLVWQDYPVNIVALVAIAQKDAKDFNDFFETFIEIVSDPINTKQLANTESFDEFILKLKTMVEVDDE